MAVQPSHLFPIKQSRIYLHMFSQPKVYASSFQTIEMLIKEDKLSSLKAYIIKEPPCEPHKSGFQTTSLKLEMYCHKLTLRTKFCVRV